MLILASGSPRRRELLAQIGVRFEVDVADIDEAPEASEVAQAYVERLALEKARVVAARHTDAVVLGADTSVIIDGEILGKPLDEADAATMLARLAGRTHQVLTAVALVNGERALVRSVITQVHFRSLSEEEIQCYVATGEPSDKAGSYGIQGFGAVLVDAIEGSYSNVVGLPLTETAAMLKEFNVPVWQVG
ncbi:MAG: septum formation protein Maf [Oceanospirillales bacterium]|jgi:septum formation protein|nr:MAG: septum formation protein Maf [Oceanospirillales bacterium]